MPIDGRTGRNVDVDVGNPDKNVNPAIHALRHFDLIQIAGRVIVYRRPQKGSQIFRISIRPRRRPGRQRRQFRFNAGREVRIETLVDHYLSGRGRKIKTSMGHYGQIPYCPKRQRGRVGHIGS